MVDTFNRLNGALATVVGKKPCRAATTGTNLFLSGYQTIDGVSFGASDEAAGLNMRVLVKDQTDQTQAGIHLVNSGLWTREPDFDGNTDFVQGTLIFVTEGVANGQTLFEVTSTDPQAVGTGAITFQMVNFNNAITISSLVAASTTDLGSVQGQVVLVSGSGATISSFGSSAVPGTMKYVIFQGANTLVYSGGTYSGGDFGSYSSALVLPGPSEGINTNAGDTAVVAYMGGGSWTVLSYQYASGVSLEAGVATIVGASSIDLGTVREQCIIISPNASITGFGSSALPGTVKFLTFVGSGSLSLGGYINGPGPSGEGLATTTGDTAIVRHEGSGIWTLLSYFRGNGHPLITGAATIASAATVDLGSYREQSITITGSVTITSFGTSAPVGTVKFVEVTDSPLLTQNSATLMMPNAPVNIQCQPGDTFIARCEASGVWRVLNFQRAFPQGSLYSDFTPTKNLLTEGAETTLMGYQVAGSSGGYIMSLPDVALRFKAWGVCSTSTMAKRIRAYYGATVVADTGAVAFAGNSWSIETIIGQTTAGPAQNALSEIKTNNPALFPAQCYTAFPAESSFGADFKITELGSSLETSAAVVQYGLTAELLRF